VAADGDLYGLDSNSGLSTCSALERGCIEVRHLGRGRSVGRAAVRRDCCGPIRRARHYARLSRDDQSLEATLRLAVEVFRRLVEMDTLAKGGCRGEPL
jgi:hypothetical protein